MALFGLLAGFRWFDNPFPEESEPQRLLALAAVVLAETFVSAPFFLQAAIAAFRRIDENLLIVARTLGASPFRPFMRVAIPLSAPSLVAGAAFAADGNPRYGRIGMLAETVGGIASDQMREQVPPTAATLQRSPCRARSAARGSWPPEDRATSRPRRPLAVRRLDVLRDDGAGANHRALLLGRRPLATLSFRTIILKIDSVRAIPVWAGPRERYCSARRTSPDRSPSAAAVCA